MYTSYFANPFLKDSNISIRTVCIARSSPKFWFGRVFDELAPTHTLLIDYKSKKINIDKYVEIYYNEVLVKFEDKVYDLYHNILGEESILLCWEKPEEFCHREIVALWFEKRLGVKIPEL